VIAACSTTHQRHGLGLIRTTTTAINTAQPTCTDGIAESWSGPTACKAMYTD
jgi:hypothetical protein